MTGNTAMPWVKLRTDYLDDIRFGRLADAPKARFFELLMLAGKLDAGGYFFEAGHELTDDEIAWKLRSHLESLQADMSILEAVALLHRNGRGWCISGFEDEQGPTQADKRSAWKDRQKKHREGHADVTSDNIVTGSNVTPTESESDLRVRVREESEEESVSPLTPLAKTDDDDTLTLTKTDLCKFVGIPAKFQQQIIQDAQIKSKDILAELTRNFARKGQGKGKVAQPGYITGMNLVKHEFPMAEWYDLDQWQKDLPTGILQKIGLVIQSDEEQENQLDGLATRNLPEEKPQQSEAEKIWEELLGLLGRVDATRDDVSTSRAISFENDVLKIATANLSNRDWLEARMTRTLKRLAVGIVNRPIEIQFVTGEEIPV